MKKINREFTIVEPEVLYEKGDRFFIFPKADSKLAKIIAPTVHLAEVREVFPYEGKYKMGCRWRLAGTVRCHHKTGRRGTKGSLIRSR